MCSSEAPRLVKLQRSQGRSFTLRLLKQQGGLCPLCGEVIDVRVKGEAVADHAHDTGRIRGVLHRSCNAALGKMDHAIGRWGSKGMGYDKIIPWLEAALRYYKQEPTRFLYWSHKTPEERAIQARRKSRGKQEVEDESPDV